MKVFIIGAGFTKAIFEHAPLNAQLLPTLAKRPNASASCKLIQRYDITDIEIALTRVDADIALCNTSGDPKDYLSELRHEVEQEIVAYFDSDVFSATSERVDSLTWLCQFLDDVVSDGDVALGLNYDCFFEGALDCRKKWTPNGGYGPLKHMLTVSDTRSPVEVLKIHGSTSFRIATDLGNDKIQRVNLAINEKYFPRSGNYRNFDFGGDDARTYLIAPSYVKRPTFEISRLMLRSAEVVAQADTLIIIGCGLRPEDMFLYLLLTAFTDGCSPTERKIVVLDPEAEHLIFKIKSYLTVDDSFCMVPIRGKLQQDSVAQLLQTLGR